MVFNLQNLQYFNIKNKRNHKDFEQIKQTMGIKTCITAIRIKDEIVHIEEQKSLSTYKIKKLNTLCPKNLSIAAIENNTIIIFWDWIFDCMGERLENNLSILENDLSINYPNSEIITIIVFDTIDMIFFSYVEDGKLKRRKGIVQDSVLDDEGFLLKGELAIAEAKDKGFERNIGNSILEYIRNKYPEKSNQEHCKIFLKYVAEKYPSTKFDYSNGSLDNYLCEHFFNVLTGYDYLSFIEEAYFATFKLKKIDFEKDSIIGYINQGLYDLSLQDKILSK